MSNFDSNGNYNKTEWKDDDLITADKLNKIEDGIETMEAMVAEVEADLEGLHAKDEELSEQLTHIANKVIDVKDFGAKGDGITDDTESIQNTIDFIHANGGGDISISNGVFMIDASVGVTLKSNVNLLFSNSKLKAIPNNLTHYQVLYIFDTENNYIRNGVIEGERDEHLGTTGEFGYGVYIKGNVKNIIFDNLTISNCWGDGILTQRYRVGGSNYIDYIPNNIYFNGVTNISNCRRQGISILAGENIFINSLICKDINGTLPMAGIDIESEHSVDLIGNIRINYLKTIRCAKCFTMRTRSRITGNITIGTLEHLDPITENWGANSVYVAPFRVMYEYFDTSQSDYVVSVENIYTDAAGVQLENLYKKCTPKVIIGNMYSKQKTYISTADPSERGLVNLVWSLDTDLSNVLGGLVINKILYENIYEISNGAINIRPYIITYKGSKPSEQLTLTDVKIDSISYVNLGDNVKIINALSDIMFENVSIKHNHQRTQVFRQDTGNKTILVEDGNKDYFVPAEDGTNQKTIYLRVFNCLKKYKVITRGLTRLVVDTAYNSTFFERVYLNGNEIPVSDTEGRYIIGTFENETNFLIKNENRNIYIETL